MEWTIVFSDERAQATFDALPVGTRAGFARVAGLIQTHWMEALGEMLNSRAGKMRLTDGEGVAGGKQVVIHGEPGVIAGQETGRQMIPIEESLARWRDEPGYRAACEALEACPGAIDRRTVPGADEV